MSLTASQVAHRFGTMPVGLDKLLEKMTRAAVASKPLRGDRFFADQLEAELDVRNFYKTQGKNLS